MSNYEIWLLLVEIQTCSNVPYDYCDRPNEKCVDTSNGPRCKCENGYERCNGNCKGIAKGEYNIWPLTLRLFSR